MHTPRKQYEYDDQLNLEKHRQAAYISILIMQRLLSHGLVIIAMHSALLFRNHYEAGIRSLTSFCLPDLLLLTKGGGSEGKREDRRVTGRGGWILCSLLVTEEGRLKEKDEK